MLENLFLNIFPKLITYVLCASGALLFIKEFYLLQVLEYYLLDIDPFNDKWSYPGKSKKIAKYYIKMNVPCKNKLKIFLILDAITQLFFLSFFLIIALELYFLYKAGK